MANPFQQDLRPLLKAFNVGHCWTLKGETIFSLDSYLHGVKKDEKGGGIRWTETEKKDLEWLCRVTESKKSDIIRRAVRAMVKFARKHKGKIVLPFEYDS